MGLKHLQASVWAIVLASAVGAVAQDSDGDSVADNAPDHCPHTPGVASNYGCPAHLEVVVVNEWWNDAWNADPFDWVTDYAVCPDGVTLHLSYEHCFEYGFLGEFAVAYYAHGDHMYTTKKDDGYVQERFADIDCDDGNTACWTLGDWAAHCEILARSSEYFDAYCDDILGRNRLDKAVEQLLMDFAEENPATTCVTGLIIGGTVARFAKVRTTGNTGFMLTNVTLVGCAIWADIRG